MERFELPSTVLETAILPLNYTRNHSKLNFQMFGAAKIAFFYKKQVHLVKKCTCFLEFYFLLVKNLSYLASTYRTTTLADSETETFFHGNLADQFNIDRDIVTRHYHFYTFW